MSELAAAGRAGMTAYERATPLLDDVASAWDSQAEALARAVLESLGIEWTGEYEWGYRTFANDPQWCQDQSQAEAMIDITPTTKRPRLVRRPKVNVAWTDVPDA